MRLRIIIAVVTTIIWEAALVTLLLWGLPQLDVQVPLPLVVFLGLALGVAATFTYRKGTQALDRKIVGGLSSMVGSRATVVRRLSPYGMIKIKGEIWIARTDKERIEAGQEVVVVEQDRLKLVVHQDTPST
jgi:membrane protein implicated in regulation of membrane protease activity